MYRKTSSIYHRIKALILFLCLAFMILGTCPIQKFLLSATSLKVKTSTKKSVSPPLVKDNLTCSYSEEIVKAPLVELTKKSNDNASLFILLNTLAYLFTCFVRKRSIPFVKRRVFFGSSVPLFLRNQVFII